MFIDADHRYEGVLTDYLLYNSLVRRGGLIVFHDIASPEPEFGIPLFCKNLSEGKIDGNKHKIYKICVPDSYAGLGYMFKK